MSKGQEGHNIVSEFRPKPVLCELYDRSGKSGNSYPTMPGVDDRGYTEPYPTGGGGDFDEGPTKQQDGTEVNAWGGREGLSTYSYGRSYGAGCSGVNKELVGKVLMVCVLMAFIVVTMLVCGAFGETGNWALVFTYLVLLMPILVLMTMLATAFIGKKTDNDDHASGVIIVGIVLMVSGICFGIPTSLYTARVRQADRYVDPARVKVLSCYRDTFVPDYHINFYHLVDKEWNISCAKRQYYLLNEEGTHYFFLVPMYYTGKATGNCKSPFLLSCYHTALVSCEELVTTCFKYPPNSVSLKTINLNEEFWKMFIDGDSAAEAKNYIQKTKPKFTDPVDFHGVPVVYGSDDMDAFDELKPKYQKSLLILQVLAYILHFIMVMMWVVAPDGTAFFFFLAPLACLLDCC